MRRLWYALLVLATLLVPFVHAPVAAARSNSSIAPRIVQLINARRAAHGLPALSVNSILTAEAQRFSRVQAELGYLSHRGNDNTNAGQRLTRAGYIWRAYGENLAAGQVTAERVVADWMASPSHRANILSSKVVEIGIGHTHRDNDPSRYYDYYVMETGKPR